MKEQIIISGFGGQGVMFSGTLLCHAAIKEGKYVTFFPSYGAEIRGGTANCQVIISEKTIGAPVIKEPDVLISLNEQSYRKFSPKVKKGGVILANTSLYKVKKTNNAEILEIPATEIAEKCGSSLCANMVMLGALIARKRLLKLDSIIDSITEILTGKSKALIEANKKAIKAGFAYKPSPASSRPGK